MSDHDLLKAVPSVIGTAVSVISAIIAVVSARSTRDNIWMARRDELVVQINQNQAKEEALAFQAALRHEELEALDPITLTPGDIQRRDELLAGLKGLAAHADNISTTRQGQPYHDVAYLDALEPSKRSKDGIAKSMRDELSIQARLDNQGFQDVLTRATDLIRKYPV